MRWDRCPSSALRPTPLICYTRLKRDRHYKQFSEQPLSQNASRYQSELVWSAHSSDLRTSALIPANSLPFLFSLIKVRITVSQNLVITTRSFRTDASTHPLNKKG